MPRFKVIVKAKFTTTYKPAVIEADDESTAHDIAEDMRIMGDLEEAGEHLNDDDVEITAQDSQEG